MDAEHDFDAFYLATRGRLLRALSLVTLDREEAQDALQEAYLRAWQRWDRLCDYDDPESWVRTVAYRRCVSHWRRLATARRTAPMLAVDETASEPDRADVLAVRQALAALSREHRVVLVLFELCDLTIEQIATETGVRPGTVKSRLSRARAALSAQLIDTQEASDA